MRSELTVLVAAMYVGVALGQNDILKEKWGLAFDYYNLVKQTDGSEEVLNYADYQAMKDNLADSVFQSVANDAADITYRPSLHDQQGNATMTKDELVNIIAADWKEGKTRSDTTYTDKMFGLITKVSGLPLTRQAFVDFGVALGVMNAAEAGAAFDRMMVVVGNSGAQVVSKDEYGEGYAIYYDDGTVTASSLPLFGEPA